MRGYERWDTDFVLPGAVYYRYVFVLRNEFRLQVADCYHVWSSYSPDGSGS